MNKLNFSLFSRFRRGKKYQPQKSREIKKIFLLPLLFLLIPLFFVLNKVTTISNITVDINNSKCADSTQIKNLILKSKYNFFSVSESLLLPRINNQYKCVDNVRISKKFPNSLEVKTYDFKEAATILFINQSIKEQIPLSSQSASLNFNINESSVAGKFLSSEEGMVYYELKDEQISSPQFYLFADEISVGKRIKGDVVKKVLDIFSFLRERSIEPKRMIVDRDKILVLSDIKLALALNKDLNRQLISLQLILEQAKMNSKVIDSIDLRFDKPVLLYSPKTN